MRGLLSVVVTVRPSTPHNGDSGYLVDSPQAGGAGMCATSGVQRRPAERRAHFGVHPPRITSASRRPRFLHARAPRSDVRDRSGRQQSASQSQPAAVPPCHPARLGAVPKVGVYADLEAGDLISLRVSRVKLKSPCTLVP